MLYQLSYASPCHPGDGFRSPEEYADTLPLRANYGTESKVSIPEAAEQTGGRSDLGRSGSDPLERWTDGAAKIVLVLQVEPKLRRQAEINAQSQGCIS